MARLPVPAHRVGWLELFFDLVFVVVIRQLTFRLHEHPDVLDILFVAFLLTAAWACWLNVTLIANTRGDVDRRHRPLVLLSMAGVGLIAIGIPDVEGAGGIAFAIGYAVARLAVWPIWAKAGVVRSKAEPLVFGPVLALGWLASIAVPEPARMFVWGGLITVEFALLLFGLPRTRTDADHMIERVGLFIMIVLGESIAELLLTAEPRQPAQAWVITGLAFAGVCAYWWIYFDLSSRRLEASRSRFVGSGFRDVLVGAHYFLILGLILLAAGLGGAIEHAGDALLPPWVAICLGSGAALFYLSTLFVGLHAGERPRGVLALAGPSALVSIAVLVFGGFWLPWVAVAVLLANALAYAALAGLRRGSGRRVVGEGVPEVQAG